MKDRIRHIFSAVLLAGILLLLLGGYLCGFKAGLPYQDPSPEMTIQWMAYYTAGQYDLKWGAAICFLGTAGMICARFLKLKKATPRANRAE